MDNFAKKSFIECKKIYDKSQENKYKIYNNSYGFYDLIDFPKLKNMF